MPSRKRDISRPSTPPLRGSAQDDNEKDSAKRLAMAQAGKAPIVGIIMGSRSDWETMSPARDTLGELGIPCEVRVVSAHRMPDEMFEYAASAARRGFAAIIAGAGGAAHLPGMTASKTMIPVIGVPVQSRRAASTRCFRSSKCRPASRSRPWPSAAP